jgi:hypothetical protein
MRDKVRPPMVMAIIIPCRGGTIGGINSVASGLVIAVIGLVAAMVYIFFSFRSD